MTKDITDQVEAFMVLYQYTGGVSNIYGTLPEAQAAMSEPGNPLLIRLIPAEKVIMTY